MRRTPTASEQLLWLQLRSKQLGVPFRRQVVVGECIVDFFASSVRLVVEVDGGCHAERSALDARRDAAFRRAGYRVHRVSEQEVQRNLRAVLQRIREAIGVGP
jgi:very-short-patch-repair endonuclease